MKIQYSKIIRYFLLILGILILILFITTLDTSQVIKSLRTVTIDIIIVVMILNALNILLKAIRWKFLIYKITGVNISLPFSFASIIAGVSAGSLTPGRGSEIAKPLMLKTSDNISLTKSVPAMIIERILDLLTIIFFFFLSFIIIPKKTAIYNQTVIPATLFFILGILLIFFIPKKIEKIIVKLIRKIHFPQRLKSKLIILTETFFQSFIILKQKKVSARVTVLSLSAFIIESIKLYLLFTLLGVKITVIIIIFSLTASLIFALITLIPGGIGITEISQVAILTGLLPIYRKELITGIIFIDRILTYYLLIFIGAIILVIYKKRKIHNGKLKSEYIKWKKQENKYQFFYDKQKIDLTEWNKLINITHSMHYLEQHKNPLIKLEEKNRRKIILNLIGDCKNKVIADIGCEEGYITKKIIRKCKKVYCIDIDKDILKKAKRNINNKKAVFVESDAQAIKLQDNSVDIAISTHILEHLPDPRKGLYELHRIIKPNGKVIINVPNEKIVLLMKKIIASLGLKFLIKHLRTGLAPGHLHIFNKKLLYSLTKGIFKVKKFKYNPPFFTNMFSILHPIKRFK